MKEELKLAAVKCLMRRLNPENVPEPDKAFIHEIADLAYLTAQMRAVAPSDKFSDIQTMVPICEAPPRLASQFCKLARGLAMHFEADSLSDPRVMRLIRRVAVHTPDIITVRVFRALYDNHHEDGVSMRLLGEQMRGLSIDTVRMVITKLTRTEAVVTTRHQKSKVDKPTTHYKLDKVIYDIIKNQKLFDSLPKNDPLYRGKRLVLKKRSNK